MDTNTSTTPARPRMRRFALVGMATVAAAAAFALMPLGSAYARAGQGHGCGAPMMGMDRGGDPAAAAARMDGMLKFMLADANATQEQRDKIAAIMKSARTDLADTQQRLRDGRGKVIDLMAAPTIDRAALEQLRVEQTQLHETVSRRMLQAAADAAEVLTPQQRAKLAETHRARMERRQAMRTK